MTGDQVSSTVLGNDKLAEGVTPSWLKWRTTGLVVVGALVLALILYAARGALLPIIASLIIADLLFPAVSFLERWLPGSARYPRAARVFAIAVVYVFILLLAGGLLYLTIEPVYREARHFVEIAPQLYQEAKAIVEESSEEFGQQVPEDVKTQLDQWLRSAGSTLGDAALDIATQTLAHVTGTISMVISLVIVPFLLFYILKDKEALSSSIYSGLPDNMARHTWNIFQLIHDVVGSYVRAQLVSAAIVGVAVFVGLFVLDIRFALTLGLLAGILALIPILGGFAGAVPGLLVTLATDPQELLWVALLYFVIQLIESNIISPRLRGSTGGLHPAVVFATLLIAFHLVGFWGLIFGVPLAAVARDVFGYLYGELSVGDTSEVVRPASEEDEVAVSMSMDEK